MSAPRLFVESALQSGGWVDLPPDAVVYLTRVLRLKAGSRLRLFNGRDGEWAAALEEVGKRGARATCLEPARAQVSAPACTLIFAPVKRAATDLIVQKATELGASVLAPVITRRTNAETTRLERWVTIAREAAEQSERLDVPEIRSPVPLEQFLGRWDGADALAFADENGGALDWGPSPASGRFAALIGPEGGFTEDERALIRGTPGARAVTLGPRILRAETAAVSALTLAMTHWGDWVAHG